MRRDLGLLAAATMGAVAASVAAAPVILTSALAIPALLVAPGYVWSAVLLPRRATTVPAVERVVLTVSLSLAILVLGGLLMAAVRLPLERMAHPLRTPHKAFIQSVHGRSRYFFLPSLRRMNSPA